MQLTSLGYIVESVIVRFNKFLTEVHSGRPCVLSKNTKENVCLGEYDLNEGMSLLEVGFLPFFYRRVFIRANKVRVASYTVFFLDNSVSVHSVRVLRHYE